MGLTKGGATWAPMFIQSLDQTTCIGCGRCFKVCSRDVFDLEEAEFEDDYGDDQVMMVMKIKDDSDCIGCQSCSKVCSKRCHTFAA
ncbi:ferredoxin III, nif-specific [Vibrio hippocampi]|uniref:Ferredoxin-3 n=1 Tax=Vibrio hippocampi TaxID=654686 RepID=A0ABN8DJ83_9VIBR|nr:ferredoxin III, nif-specific [Vibrio hippocampi]CAH0529275.1 Ferredoxin-3 [Vibrio hippocampi]